MSNKYAIVSNCCPAICDKLSGLGYKLIYTQSVDGFISYEQKHADMQCIAFSDTVFILKECVDLKERLKAFGFNVNCTENYASSKYPKNIVLNAKIVGNHLIGNIKCLDEKLLRYCTDNGYSLIDVRQGYAACSIAKVTDNAIITTDESIYRALNNTEIDVLKISNDNIELCGAKMGESGFIGGASALLEDNNLLFFGDIEKHPDYNLIEDFCNQEGVNILKINNMQLTDIGGTILLKN